MGLILILTVVGFYIIAMANLPQSNSGSFDDYVVSPKNLPLLVGNPTKLELEVTEFTNTPEILWVTARTPAGLALALLRDTSVNPAETQIRISKTGWIGYVVFNFEGPVIRSMVLGNGRVISPERLRGETRALAGRLFQRLYELGLNAPRVPQPRSG